MALTQISTAGVKDDAVTAGKIPANAVGTSEIANDAVTSTQIADNTIVDGDIADATITLNKLVHGTSSNDGKFLRANNGADPTFETVSTDLVGDTSPQLGGDLQSNGNDIDFAETDKATFGTDQDLQIYHQTNTNILGTSGVMYLHNTGASATDLDIRAQNDILLKPQGGEQGIKIIGDGAVELYYNNYKKFETTDVGVRISHTGDANLQLVADSDNNGSNNWPHVQFRVDNTSGQAEAQVAYRQDNAVLKVDIAGTEKVGVNANGLVFNGDTAAANALDDYEEGTWTPQVLNGWGILNPTYDENVGLYVKVGKIVHVLFRIDLSGGSTNGNRLAISGFPFIPATIGSTGYVALNGYCDTASSNAQSIFCMVGKSATTAELFKRISTGESSFSGTELGNTGQMNFSGTFTTT